MATKKGFKWEIEGRATAILKIWINEKNRGASITDWGPISDMFNTQTGNSILPSQVKNYYDSLKEKYKCYVTLQSMTGLGMNKTTGEVDAEEIKSPRFQAFLKQFPKHGAKVARGDIPNLDLIEKLFGGQTAQGVGGCFSPAMAKSASYVGKGKTNIVDLNKDAPLGEEGCWDSNEAKEPDVETGDESEAEHMVRQRLGKKRQSDEEYTLEMKRRNDSFDEVIQLIAGREARSQAAEAESTRAAAAAQVAQAETLPTKCMRELSRMGIEYEEGGDDTIVAAMHYLQDTKNAETFLALMNDNQRRIFLKRIMRED